MVCHQLEPSTLPPGPKVGRLKMSDTFFNKYRIISEVFGYSTEPFGHRTETMGKYELRTHLDDRHGAKRELQRLPKTISYAEINDFAS